MGKGKELIHLHTPTWRLHRGDLFNFCILVLLAPSIRCGRQNRLLTVLRVLNQPGRMFCASESSESSDIVLLSVLPQGELRISLHWG